MSNSRQTATPCALSSAVAPPLPRRCKTLSKNGRAQSSSLRVVALISGGKDSLFSILHCMAQGHDIIALANLHPLDTSQEDTESHMYQTIGHSVVPLYSQALGLPLYRHPIIGTNVNKNKEYRAPEKPPPHSFGDQRSEFILEGKSEDREQDHQVHEQDETESLFKLLQHIKMNCHPEADAVCSGAILSTYQRTRVENVAVRLGLASLSYLWQYPSLPPYCETQLLKDMEAVGQDARIIKVASGGLDEKFLWQNVAESSCIRMLERQMRRFDLQDGDGAMLGEGGEFETLAIDGPKELWDGKITFSHVDKSVSCEGGTAAVRLSQGHVVSHEVENDTQRGSALDALRVPDLFDDEFKELLKEVLSQRFPDSPASTAQETQDEKHTTATQSEKTDSYFYTWQEKLTNSYYFISNMTGDEPNCPSSPGHQMEYIVRNLRERLKIHGLSPKNIVYSTLMLEDMSAFGEANAEYSKLFDEPNPPARVTFSLGDMLHSGCHLILSVKAVRDSPSQKICGLHVQSRSYWAPANIGPYSQAISAPVGSDDSNPDESLLHVVDVAGQIPLDPASMQLLDYRKYLHKARLGDSFDVIETPLDRFKHDAVLSLQHLWRIGRAMDVKMWITGVALISTCGESDAIAKTRIAIHLWKSIHDIQQSSETANLDDEEQDNFDVWDLKNRFGMSKQFNKPQNANSSDWRYKLGSSQGLCDSSVDPHVCFVVQVDQLPRAADIEWTSSGATELVRYARRLSREKTVQHEFTHQKHGGQTDFMRIFQEIAIDGEWETMDPQKQSRYNNAEHTLVYGTHNYLRSMAAWSWKGIQVIPCRRIWNSEGLELAGITVLTSYF